MKKIFTYSFLFALCFSFFASCSKDVKAPVKVAGATTASTNTYSGTQTTQSQGGHTCGGGGSHTDYNSGGGY
jgi:hypothetical protein